MPDQMNLFEAKVSYQAKAADVQIDPSWKKVLAEEFTKPYFAEIKNLLKKEKEDGQRIYPPGPLIFNAFNLTPFDNVKVVVLGQDPYHGKGQAHGLCFSVPNGITPPPSLINIFKEIQTDLNITPPHHGNLEAWAKRGVFLLNAMLTVRANQPASHQGIGWQQFTDKVIQTISDRKRNVVFMLWGKFAMSKSPLIDPLKHLILTAAHPSPYSASAGFFGCGHFSQANQYLQRNGIPPIDWKLDDAS